MGVGPQYTIAQLDENGVAVPISVDNPLKISGGGGGGAVDSVNGQTGIVVLNSADVGAVPATTDASRVYGTGTDGSQSPYAVGGGAATAWSIAQRGADGVLLVGTPTADNHAATKKYVDDGTVPKYTGSSQLRAYASHNANNQNIHIDSGTGGNTIAYRGTGGTLSVATPTANNHATTKQYVDLRVPVPPATGTYTLQSVDGVTSWVEVQ